MIPTTLTTTDYYLGMIIGGITTGFGVAIGTYIAQKHFLEGLKKLFTFRRKK